MLLLNVLLDLTDELDVFYRSPEFFNEFFIVDLLNINGPPRLLNFQEFSNPHSPHASY